MQKIRQTNYPVVLTIQKIRTPPATYSKRVSKWETRCPTPITTEVVLGNIRSCIACGVKVGCAAEVLCPMVLWISSLQNVAEFY